MVDKNLDGVTNFIYFITFVLNEPYFLGVVVGKEGRKGKVENQL